MFLPHEDSRDGPNLFFVHRFNLAHLPHVQRMLVGVRFGELASWPARIARVSFLQATGAAAAEVAEAAAGGSEAAAAAVQNAASRQAAGQKRRRTEDAQQEVAPPAPDVKDEERLETAEGAPQVSAPAEGLAGDAPSPFQDPTALAPGSDVPSLALNPQAAAPIAAVPSAPAPAPPAGPPARTVFYARKNTPKPSAKQLVKRVFNPAQLRPWPHALPHRVELLARGIDCLLLAVPYDPLPLVLAALRYCRPCAALAVFHSDLACLARLYKRLRELELAINLQIEERFTRELQVLPARTHPHMQMHSASGYLLTGVIVPTEYSALHIVDLDDEPPRGEAAVGASGDMKPAADATQSSGAAAASSIDGVGDGGSADVVHMQAACDLAFCCEPVASAYNVGAVLVDSAGRVAVTGFSRELEGNTHAEEVCLLKPGGSEAARGGTLYSTMEPCGQRLSGKLGCAQRIVEAGVARVVLAVAEPPNFVPKCEGADLLRAAGVRVDVIADADCRQRALDANAHLLKASGQ